MQSGRKIWRFARRLLLLTSATMVATQASASTDATSQRPTAEAAIDRIYEIRQQLRDADAEASKAGEARIETAQRRRGGRSGWSNSWRNY